MKAQIKLNFRLVLLVMLIFSYSCEKEPSVQPPVQQPVNQSTTETFTFSSNGIDIKGKIFLPASYATNKNLPAIYLIDYKEQHYQVATDEFEKVISGVNQIDNFDALIVTLAAHSDIETDPGSFQDHYNIFKSMTSYVDENYTDNTSRTFIGRGSEAGIVLLSLLHENSSSSKFENFIATDPSHPFLNMMKFMIENNDVPDYTTSKKLHFSFSSSNNYASCTYLIDLIEDEQFPWLKFGSEEYPNNVYEDTYPISFAVGLKFVFEN